MKWIIAGFASMALAILSLSIPSPVFTTEAHADRMNGKGNCAGGVCTGGGTVSNPSGAKRYPKTTKNKTTK
jgi:hypothetical protein